MNDEELHRAAWGEPRFVNPMYRIVLIVITVAIVLFALGQGIKMSKTMPNTATVYLDDQARTYFAPPCVGRDTALRGVTAGEAHLMGYEPDRDCKNKGWFTQKGRSLSADLLQRFGVLAPLPSRWNPDGSWNY